jgi:hypothetical protein
LNESQGVYRCTSFSLGSLQRKHQLLGAGSAAAHENHPADGKGDPEDHPDRSQAGETEHKANKHCRSDDRACSSSQYEPSATLDRLPEFFNTNFKLLDLLEGRGSVFEQWIFGSHHERYRRLQLRIKLSPSPSIA